ncbi:putative metalloprotease CJM1_0395 family protein [Pseudoalteromonas byunsanensis]|uniref:Catalase n=1 Tax=Pseudoalteromonas byunsanensis TaxID=327939 RepID=A0A1S1N9A6_9GAMM|nr:putative metalloprotease CJM1_0395 family protein [Pseudoalteromonas byunsanensis]OHU96100.1 catalase [Pseudoalteromonas byunsanensis]
MNIVTPPPAMNLNTANVYTETVKRDNQLREIIPKAPPSAASFTENKPANEGDKTKANSPDESSLYTNNGQLAKNKTIEEKEQQGQQQGQQQGSDKEEKQDSRSESEEKAQQQEIQELKSRDQEVRLHEQAHARVGGQYAGSPNYEYQRGPDGNNYAVGGEVMIDVAEVPGDPKQTIDKMQTVRAAALAPAEPSGADRAIAADATQKISAAQAELAKQQISGDDGEQDSANGIGTYQTRRLKDEDEEDTPVQRERAALRDDADPYAVALPIERDPQIQARALRINNFYQHIASPDTPASLSLRV